MIDSIDIVGYIYNSLYFVKGSVYKKVNPMEDIQRNKTDNFWQKQEVRSFYQEYCLFIIWLQADEERRKQEDKARQQQQRQQEERERKEREVKWMHTV